jgi:hypothetical protein
MAVPLLLVVLACFFVYDHARHKAELEITRKIELANWQKLNQLESRINGQNKRIYRNNEKVVDCLKKQIYNAVYIDCEL